MLVEQVLWLLSLQMGRASLFLHVLCGCVVSELWACGSACVGTGDERPSLGAAGCITDLAGSLGLS